MLIEIPQGKKYNERLLLEELLASGKIERAAFLEAHRNETHYDENGKEVFIYKPAILGCELKEGVEPREVNEILRAHAPEKSGKEERKDKALEDIENRLGPIFKKMKDKILELQARIETLEQRDGQR